MQKEQILRILEIEKTIDAIIADESIAADTLKNLRTGRTMIKKALKAVSETELEELYSQTEKADQEILPVSNRLSVSLGLRDGQKIEMDLPERLAGSLLAELRRPGFTRGFCACHVDGELISIDTQEVLAVTVAGIQGGTWFQKQIPESWTRPEPKEREFTPYTDEKEFYQVQCRCGVEYTCSMNPGRGKARCRDCSATVFADREASVEVNGFKATLLTNRYWVEKEWSELREQRNNFGRNYMDPCDPFDVKGGEE